MILKETDEKTNPAQVALFIMGEKGYVVLESLLAADPTSVECVICSEDRSISRDFYEPIKEKCLANHIPFYNKKDQYSINSEYAYVVGWRWLLYLDEIRAVIFHDSLLPKYRGFNPLASALINGESKIGVTALHAHLKFDCGNIIAQESVSVFYPLTLSGAIDKILPCYTTLAVHIWEKIKNGKTLAAIPQNEAEATYSLWRDAEDYRIDWKKDASHIKRHIDALGSPYLGATALLDGRLVRILEAEEAGDVTIENRSGGKVLFKEGIFPVVVCNGGLLKIISIRDQETGDDMLPLKKFRIRFG